MKYLCIILLYVFVPVFLFSQGEPVFQTFRSTRVINSHSVETIQQGMLDFRITHRFGDVGGSSGGWQNFFGLENATDILIGFEYGLANNVNIGISRTKGAGPLKQNVNSLVKIRLITQEIKGNQPLSLTFVGTSSISTMEKSNTEGVLHYFDKPVHRWTHHLGLLLARKFSERLTLQFGTSWTYRNIVQSDDKNDLISFGGALRYHFGKSMGVLIEGTFPVSDIRTPENGYYPSLGLGLEFDTNGGHVFQLNLTNSAGIQETDYIPYTRSNWADGEFRIGFTISRLFKI